MNIPLTEYQVYGVLVGLFNLTFILLGHFIHPIYYNVLILDCMFCGILLLDLASTGKLPSIKFKEKS
jgi:hypothetical protein